MSKPLKREQLKKEKLFCDNENCAKMFSEFFWYVEYTIHYLPKILQDVYFNYFDNIQKYGGNFYSNPKKLIPLWENFLQQLRKNFYDCMNKNPQADLQRLIEYQKEEIANLNQQLNQNIIKNTQLMRQLSVHQEQANLIIELNNQQNHLQEITIHQQIEYIDENSIRIKLDDTSFQENVQKLNKEQEQMITKMKDLLEEFQQFQPNLQLKLNRVQDIDQSQVQNIINIIKDTINSIIELEYVTIKFQTDLESFLKHENDQVKETTLDIVKKLEKNTACFNCVKKIFEAIIKILQQLVTMNQELRQDNQIFQDQLKGLYDKNNEFENKMSNLLTKMNEQTIQGKKKIITIQENQLNNYQQDNQQILRGYDFVLLNTFIQQIMDDINNLVSINLAFFLSWNNNPNFKLKNSELINSTNKLITYLQSQKIRIDIDILVQEFKRNLQQIEQGNFNSDINQYNCQNLQCLLKLLQTLSSQKKEIDGIASTDNSLIQLD